MMKDTEAMPLAHPTSTPAESGAGFAAAMRQSM